MAHMQNNNYGQKQQQQSGSGSSSATQPIVSLSPFLGNNWAVRARVTDKAQIREWNKSDKSGALMSLTLLDDTGSIRATFFGANRAELEEVSKKLVNGSLYVFMNGAIKNANKRFSSVNNDYEITFSSLQNFSGPLADTANDIPQARYNFLPLASLPQREKDTLVDVVFYVKEVEQARAFQAKSSGKSMTKRTVLIADKTAMAELTLWNDDASNCNMVVGNNYILKGAKVGNYQGSASLGVWNLAESLKDVDDKGIMEEIERAKQVEKTSGVPLVNVSKVDSSNYTGEHSRVARRHLDDIQRLNLGTDPNQKYGDSLDVRCIPTFIKTESFHYEACAKCNKKVSDDGPGRYKCPNEACAGMSIVMNPRYMISIQASDGVAQTWITLFDEAGRDFFGMSAHELLQKINADSTFLTQHCLSLLYKPMLFRLKAKQEMRGENNEMRMNISANRVTRLVEDRDFSTEMEKLEEFINLYDGAPDVAGSPNRVH